MTNSRSPMQVFRYCPKCGNNDFLADTEKSMKCGNCSFRYYINMSAAVVAIIRNELNEVLFTIRKHEPFQGFLDLPGGFVDLGETAENAVTREVYEELNLKVTKLTFKNTFTNNYIFGGIEYQTLDLVFNCEVESLMNMKAADDVSGYLFKHPAKVKEEEIGLTSIKQILKQLLSNNYSDTV